VTRVEQLRDLLRLHVSGSDREESDRCAMLRLVDELGDPLSRREPSAHFTASAFVVDATGSRTCLVEHAKLGRLLQPGGHIEDDDPSVEDAALREAREETSLDVQLRPDAPRPFDVDIHRIPAISTPGRPGEPSHLHLDVRFLLVGSGDPCAGAAWYELGTAGDESVDRLAAKARTWVGLHG
jgi:8-oxo-dGTP pyrophosphatase MutT (NUDIX family)